MSEPMVYGGYIASGTNSGTAVPYLYTADFMQLKLFELDKTKICTRSYWWLRDVVTSAYFAIVAGGGYSGSSGASNSNGVRPAFGIC